MRPFLIGIAGRSGAGKSEIARQLAAWLPGDPQVVSLDSYYYAMDHVPLEERGRRNFDHPDALDWPLIEAHIEALSRGESIAEPIYIFATHTRSPESRPVRASRYIILEGLFALHDERVRSHLAAKIFIETPDPVCFERRKERDVMERGRTVPDIERQYSGTVRPMAEQFVMPTSQQADLVLRGDLPLAETVAVVKAFLKPPVLMRMAPVINVPDIAAAIDYYTSTLGFERIGGHAVRRDQVELRFACGSPQAIELRVSTSEVEKLHRELGGAGNAREFTVTDPHGVKLTFQSSE